MLPAAITVSHVLPASADAVLLVTPVQHLRAALSLGLPAGPLVLCMKGLEAGSNLFAGEIAGPRAAILTGPNFAHELARGLPAAAVLASRDPAVRGALLPLLGTREYRLYGSADPVGAQVGGAAKNVIAIAAGVAIGAGLGENARAALVTRGLAEIARLAVALGGRAETVSGLSGLGDLMLTCAGAASRNYRLGLALGQGVGAAAAREAIGAAVEGMEAAPALLARAGGVSCPIIAAVCRRAGRAGRCAWVRWPALLDRPGSGRVAARMLRGILTVGGWTMGSRLLGFGRDILIAALAGTGGVADAFFVANKLPNMFRRLFGEGAFNAAFVPEFTGLLATEGHEAAKSFAQQAISVLAFWLLG